MEVVIEIFIENKLKTFKNVNQGQELKNWDSQEN
jgi:hypothetical protein